MLSTLKPPGNTGRRQEYAGHGDGRRAQGLWFWSLKAGRRSWGIRLHLGFPSSCCGKPVSAQHASANTKVPFSEVTRKARPGTQLGLPPGPAFRGCFWTQPRLPAKLWVDCGPCSCGRGLRDRLFLSAKRVALCHKKVQHMHLLRIMHHIYFLTSKWINFSDSVGNERKITCFWTDPRVWFFGAVQVI